MRDYNIILQRVLIAIVLFVIFMLAMFVLREPAQSHEWYPSNCCDQRDCRVLQPEEVKLMPKQYIIAGHIIPRKETLRNSPDGNYHACFMSSMNDAESGIRKTVDKRTGLYTYCIWAPLETF